MGRKLLKHDRIITSLCRTKWQHIRVIFTPQKGHDEPSRFTFGRLIAKFSTILSHKLPGSGQTESPAPSRAAATEEGIEGMLSAFFAQPRTAILNDNPKRTFFGLLT